MVEEQCIYNCFFPQQFPYFCDINHFVFVSVHHHGRSDHPAGHRHHVPPAQDGVHPDPQPGGGALAAAAPLLSRQVSDDTKIFVPVVQKIFSQCEAIDHWPDCGDAVTNIDMLSTVPSHAMVRSFTKYS